MATKAETLEELAASGRVAPPGAAAKLAEMVADHLALAEIDARTWTTPRSWLWRK
jgi:hypothetical protein